MSSNPQQSVVVGWCSYLAIGSGARIASFVRWSDGHLANELSLDLGMEWTSAILPYTHSVSICQK